MKNILTFLGATIIASFIMVSCSQNSNKQKELELKERELALKEKELSLKEKEIPKSDSFVQPAKQIPNGQTINVKENTDVKLVVNPQNIEVVQGQVTFQQKGKTLFYFDLEHKKGKIVLNGKEYTLKKINNNNTSYKLTGDQVEIKTSNFIDQTGDEDCLTSRVTSVLITLNNISTSVKDITITECNYYP